MAKNVWTKSVSKALYDRISRPFKFYEIHFQVNGSDFVGITHKRAVDLLRNAGQVAVLVVERIVGRAVWPGRPRRLRRLSMKGVFAS